MNRKETQMWSSLLNKSTVSLVTSDNRLFLQGRIFNCNTWGSFSNSAPYSNVNPGLGNNCCLDCLKWTDRRTVNYFILTKDYPAQLVKLASTRIVFYAVRSVTAWDRSTWRGETKERSLSSTFGDQVIYTITSRPRFLSLSLAQSS